MKIAPFETEQFFARYEFTTRWQLCNSDCETISIAELLALAGGSLEELGRQPLGYTESQGHPNLRAAIAAIYQQISPEDAVVLATPIEGIYLTARALLEPGDEVIVLSPAYDALFNMFAHVVGEKQVKKWKFAQTDTAWTLNLDDLQALITPRTKMVVVNFPHNPTGYLPTTAMLKSLGSIVEAHDLWLFSDEMYFGLVHSGTEPVISAAKVSRKSIVLSGLSKTHGLPGLRCGWLIIQDEEARKNIMNWKYYTSICPPMPSEYLAIAALRVWRTLRDRNVARIEKNLVLAQAFFARWPKLFSWRPPMAGSTALVACHVPSVGALAAHLAQEEGILIHPASTLGSDDHHMRIGLGREGFAEALEQFELWLQSTRGQKFMRGQATRGQSQVPE